MTSWIEHIEAADCLRVQAEHAVAKVDDTTMQHEQAVVTLASIGVLLAQAQLHATLAVAKK